MAKKNWAKDAFNDIREGRLKRLGWPNAEKLVEAARRDRAGVVRALLLLQNASSDGATRARAAAIIRRIRRELGDKGEKG